eukprot:s1604_g8.t1
MHPWAEEEVLDVGWRELIISVYRSSNLSVALWNVDPKLRAHAFHVQCVLALAPHGFVCECKIRKYSGVIGDLEDAVSKEVRGLYHEITRTTVKLYDGVRLSDNDMAALWSRLVTPASWFCVFFRRSVSQM